MKITEIITESKAVKQRLDPKCWTGKHKEGTKIKGGVRVNNCVPNESVEENMLGFLSSEQPKRKDKLSLSQMREIERVRAEKQKTNPKIVRATDLPKNPDHVRTVKADEQTTTEGLGYSQDPEQAKWYHEGRKACKHGTTGNLIQNIAKKHGCPPEWLDAFHAGYQDQEGWEKHSMAEAGSPAKQAAIAINMKKHHQKPKSESITEDLTLDEQFDIIEEMVESLAEQHGVDAEVIWEDFESVDDDELYETAAWRRKEGKSKSGGLNKKGVASYRREHPGSKLQTAVTTKPSKLKKGSKASKRRKSFCARMSGVKGPMKKPNGKPTRKALALRKWNC